MTSLKDKYAIVGVGHSRLGKVPDLSDYGLQLTAVKAALDDAGLKKKRYRRSHHSQPSAWRGAGSPPDAFRAPGN